MATKRYQILGDIVTGAQLDEKLKDYIPADDNAALVSWVEVLDCVDSHSFFYFLSMLILSCQTYFSSALSAKYATTRLCA